MANRVRIWNKKEIEFLKNSINKLTIQEIADKLNRTINSVVLYMYRHDISRHETVKRNLMRELIATKIPIEYFHPTKQFYKETNINQCQFQSIWHGYRQATNDEMGCCG
jgi:hypothetical protein